MPKRIKPPDANCRHVVFRAGFGGSFENIVGLLENAFRARSEYFVDGCGLRRVKNGLADSQNWENSLPFKFADILSRSS
jgi:hypothetical protein